MSKATLRDSNRYAARQEGREPPRAERTPDPSFNVREALESAVKRIDNLREGETHRIDHDIETEVRRLDEKFRDGDTKYQIQFNAAKEALGIALIAQEKAVSAALDSTKEAIGKAEIATDKRFDLLSEKIDGVNETLNKSAGAQGIYVTHTDLVSALDKLQSNIEASLKPLTTFMNNSQGRGGGAKDMYGWIVGGVMALIALISFVVPYLK